MSNPHSGFVAAINANPHDMQSRGAYADWLEEGDHADPHTLDLLRDHDTPVMAYPNEEGGHTILPHLGELALRSQHQHPGRANVLAGVHDALLNHEETGQTPENFYPSNMTREEFSDALRHGGSDALAAHLLNRLDDNWLGHHNYRDYFPHSQVFDSDYAGGRGDGHAYVLYPDGSLLHGVEHDSDVHNAKEYVDGLEKRLREEFDAVRAEHHQLGYDAHYAEVVDPADRGLLEAVRGGRPAWADQ